MVKKKTLDPFVCPNCSKEYISKTWFVKHTDSCQNTTGSLAIPLKNKPSSSKKTPVKPKIFPCLHCEKCFASPKTLSNHLKTIHSSVAIPILSHFCRLDDVFDFANVFGADIEAIFDNDFLPTRQYVSYLSQLTRFCPEKDKLKILHLNINSLFSKCFELNQILETENFDLIFLNETKLDSCVPHSFYKPVNYNIIRRDRTRYGGGVMVLYKKSINLISSYCLDYLEIIHLKLNLNSIETNFLCCYNPNYNQRIEFISRLETYLFGIDLSSPIFIIGDLNIDLQSNSKTSEINVFSKILGFHNEVKQPTRSVMRRSRKNHSSFIDCSSLIDVVLHNSDLECSTSLIGCPFSDHKFVACSISSPPIYTKAGNEFIGRSYSVKNMTALNNAISATDFSSVTLESIQDPNIKLGRFNAVMTELIDKFCPLQTFTVKDKDVCPWMNRDLLALKNERDYYLSLFESTPDKSKSSQDWVAYTSIRSRWQKANREAQSEYYKSKQITDFKNSKKFWDYYKASIRVKSDLPASFLPTRIVNEDGRVLSSPSDVADGFNKFLTNIKSSSKITLDSAEHQIYKTFSLLKEKKN
jgi:transcription elongation factor Elf1